MLPLEVAHVEDFCERARELRYIEHRPMYDALATYLNANGGKSTDGKQLPKSKRFTAEELMPPAYMPVWAQPLRLTPGEARAILAALPKMGASWVLQAFVNRIMPLDEVERAAK